MLPSHEEIQKIKTTALEHLPMNSTVWRLCILAHRRYLIYLAWETRINLKEFSENINISYPLLKNWKIGIRKEQVGIQNPWSNISSSEGIAKDICYTIKPAFPKPWSDFRLEYWEAVEAEKINATFKLTESTESIESIESTELTIISKPEPELEVSMQSFTPGDQLREELFNQLAAECKQAEELSITLRHRMTVLSEQWNPSTT